MNKKLLLAVVVVSVTFIVVALNVRLNTIQKNFSTSLRMIESLSNENDDDDDYDIDLLGSLYVIPTRSYSQPLQATKYSSYIKVYYLADLTNITVKIVNASGQTVYSSNVNPVAGGQLYISLAGLPDGDYTLVFSNTAGGSMYGDFEI